MDISKHKSAEEIVETLGNRLKQTRLNANVTQAKLADQVGIDRKTVIRAEKGQADLMTVVKILKVLGLEKSLDAFLPEPEISPVQLAKLRGKKRERATSQGNEKEHDDGGIGW